MKKTGLIIILLVSACVVKAQRESVIQNIVLSDPVIDSSKIDPYLHFCGISRDTGLNCLDNEYSQKETAIWRKYIKIQSKGAKEIKIVFRKFILSPNAIVSFYTDSLRYQYQGAYFIHKSDSSFISDFLSGEHCTIVIEIPMDEFDKNQILISQIKHFTESFEDAVRGADYSCMIDVNCSEGNDWCDQKRSVALYYFTQNGMDYLCTGALVNNYRNDFTQYFLTARHCTNGTIDWSNTEFYFNYQNSSCNSGDGWEYSYYRVQGSQLVGYCDISWSDNALLLIIDPIPIQYNVYYSGVDITDRSAGDEVTCIHHSFGWKKMIAFAHIQNFAGPKWEIYFDNGITKSGGSGAPIFFNSNKRVIATVSGGFPDMDCTSSLKQKWVGKVKACSDIEDALFGNSGLDTYAGIDPIKTCQSTLNLQGEFHSTQEYDATLNGLTIQTGNTITVSNATFHEGSNYTLTAGDRIVFQPGTKIEAGAVINAKISPCSGSLVSCGTHSSNYKSAGNFSQEHDDSIIEDDILHSDIITIHPNPNNGTFTIKTNLDEEEILSIQVYNILGQRIYKQTGISDNTIQLPQLAKGIFWVEIMTQSQPFIKKITVK